jgi:hypothetical protein
VGGGVSVRRQAIRVTFGGVGDGLEEPLDHVCIVY